MVWLQFLLVCASMYGLDVLADKVLQPYGPKMCNALCYRMNCSDVIFDEVMLICNLHFPIEPRRVASSELHMPKQFESGFFVQTYRKLYHFDDYLRKHRMTLKGLPRLKLFKVFFGCVDQSLYAFAKGQFYVAPFNNYKVHFRKKFYIKELKKWQIDSIAINKKNKVLATIYTTSGFYMTFHIFSLERSGRIKGIVKTSTTYNILCHDEKHGLVFYIDSNDYISSIDCSLQTMRKYHWTKRNFVIDFEFEDESIFWYTCIKGNPMRYQYDMTSEKTTKKKLGMLRPCDSRANFIKVGDKIVKTTETRRGIVVTGGGIRQPFLKNETPFDMFKPQ